jgi:CheY-like chemotaxis protein
MVRQQILIVDDYAGARYYRSRVLSEAGYEVFEASTGEQGLELATALTPALILLDVNLPDMTGIEVCEKLKANPKTAQIPVIQVTGAWRSEEARRCGMASGANAYLVEPIDAATLLRHVGALLESAT